MKKSLVALSALAVLGAGVLIVSATADAASLSRANNTAKARSANGQHMSQLTDAQKAELESQRTARQVAAQTHRIAVQAALDNSDYSAWLTAIGTSSSISTKINSDNFPKLVEAYKLRAQADKILEDLGLEHGKGLGIGGLEAGLEMRGSGMGKGLNK